MGVQVILVDNRTGSKELLPYIRAAKVQCELAQLEFGDACFEGNGPEGRILVGVERKTLGDMLNCIDDARYAAHQRPGMLSMYNRSILMIEGEWKPDLHSGYMMWLAGHMTWKPFSYRSRYVAYSKLFRYLMSIQMSGVIVMQTRDLEHTAFNICECCYYFGKKWADHTALQEMQKFNLPDLNGRPSLVRRWAAALDGVGVKHSLVADKTFKTPLELAQSDELDWVRIPGIGVKLAKSIVRSIHGIRNGKD